MIRVSTGTIIFKDKDFCVGSEVNRDTSKV